MPYMFLPFLDFFFGHADNALSQLRKALKGGIVHP